jgi:hypothetical protein
MDTCDHKIHQRRGESVPAQHGATVLFNDGRSSAERRLCTPHANEVITLCQNGLVDDVVVDPLH